MANQIETRSEYRSVRYAGGKILEIRHRVTKGPNNLLDRFLTLNLSFQELEEILKVYEIGKSEYAKSEARIADHTRRNNTEE